jgi:leucyl aminopeptidase
VDRAFKRRGPIETPLLRFQDPLRLYVALCASSFLFYRDERRFFIGLGGTPLLTVEIRPGDPASLAGDALVQFLFEDDKELTQSLSGLDSRLDGAISELVSSEEVKGKLHEATILHTANRLSTRRLLILGAGKRADFSTERISRLFGQAAREANSRGWATLVIDASALSGSVSAEDMIQSGVSGAIIALGRGDLYKTGERPEDKLQTLLLAGPETDGWETAANVGQALGEGVNFARELVYQPPADLTPAILGERARALGGELGFETTLLDKKALKELGAGALLAVSRGSSEEPRMIRLRYGNFPGKPVIGLVGKGITFDSGGLCIKSADGMADMKIDMGGAAAVLGAMYVIGRLKPEINVVAVCPACENMTGPSAYKPGDVVRTLNGKTIEILNTDAEGRVILADGLAYAQQSGATHIVDLATLTGACVIALGNHCTGVMGGPQEWIDRVLSSAKEAGEKMWQLPLFDEYKEQIKSDIADVENSGGRSAGAQTGALLLKEFVNDDVQWAHLDIAGTAWTTSDTKYQEKGATGVGVRTLVKLVEGLAG